MPDMTPSKERPLSPHLQIYKPQITSVSSVLHRFTGVALTIGLVLMTWGLMSLAGGRECYEVFIDFCTSIIGQIMLFGWTAAFSYHFFSGLRHLVRDCGYWYENKDSCITGWAVIGLSTLMTLGIWLCVYRNIFIAEGI